jgi:hypothetical protein
MESPMWERTALSHSINGLIPLKGKLLKQLSSDYGMLRVFHGMNIQDLNGLFNIEGSNKSISSSTETSTQPFFNEFLDRRTVALLDGNFVVGRSTDMFSMPDKQGLRWIESSHFSDTPIKELIDELAKENKKRLKAFYRKHFYHRDINYEYMEHNAIVVIEDYGTPLWDRMYREGDTWRKVDPELLELVKEFRTYIVYNYVKKVQEIILSHKEIFIDMFLNPQESMKAVDEWGKTNYNEILVNKIRVKAVYLLAKEFKNDVEDMNEEKILRYIERNYMETSNAKKRFREIEKIFVNDFEDVDWNKLTGKIR